MSQAADYLAPIEPTELGTMTIGGHAAGYARAYDEEHGWCDTEMVFVMDSTCSVSGVPYLSVVEGHDLGMLYL